MGVFNSIKRLYSVETLDYRFVESKRTVKTEVLLNDSEINASNNTLCSHTSQCPLSRWCSTEFYIYYLCFIVIIPLMIKQVVDVSKGTHVNFPQILPYLSHGWLFGRLVDSSDEQYESFRDNLPPLLFALVLHQLLRHVVNLVFQFSFNLDVKPAPHSHSSTDFYLTVRTYFDLIFGLAFLSILHGFSIFKITLILTVNYQISQCLPRSYVPACTWVFGVSMLFLNELCRGYRVSDFLHFFLAHNQDGYSSDSSLSWLLVFDKYLGLITRWELLYKVTILRMISFNMDFYWSLGDSKDHQRHRQLSPRITHHERVSIPACPTDYNFRNFLAYALYSPLYLAGPILTFNSYISQIRYPPQNITRQSIFFYAIRLCIAIFTMEVFIHYIYAVAIFKASPDWHSYTPFQLAMLGFFNLFHIWLKLLISWRFFRFWALLDGVDAPENMIRCVANNFSTLAFWRGWHKSFNRWILRYIYIPLGGSYPTGRKGLIDKVCYVARFLIVFSFVAVWHDLKFRLLQWGWLITLFVLPEYLAGLVIPKSFKTNRPEFYRAMCGVGAVGNIFMMSCANLVGFAIGLDGIESLISKIIGSYVGLLFLVLTCGTLYVGAQVMFELRNQELRRGIDVKC